jgi:hypothetical protein
MMIACTAPSRKTKPVKKSAVPAVNKKIVKTDSSKSSIQKRLCDEAWTYANDEITVMQFDKDSIYYVDEDPIIAVSYTLKGNKLILHYGNNGYVDDIVKKLSFHKDTLVIENRPGNFEYFLPIK